MKSTAGTNIKRTRVVLADNHPVVVEGLASILESQGHIEIVGKAYDGEEASELYDQFSPDVRMLDCCMQKKNGLQVVIELMSRRGFPPRITVITAYESEQDIRQAMKAGAKAFLGKGAPPQQIREAVRRVANGETFLPPEIGSKLAESMSHLELSHRNRGSTLYGPRQK